MASKEASAGTYLDYLRSTLPASWSADAAHIRLIAEHLDKVESGEIDRLAIHMPPRHGKSESVTYRFPVRWMERNPGHNVLVTAYNERFARKFGRRNRNLAIERGLTGDAKTAEDEWETNSGGLFMARGVGSPPMGTGFNLIVIDDPIKSREEADSETYREKAWDWYTDDLYTRLEPDGAIILIMTLWHHDDVGTRAVASEEGKWTVLKLPAFAQENDPLGRDKGEPLWPERWDAEQLSRRRQVMLREEGERSWEAVYQCNPTPREGSMFKVGNIEFVDAVPANMRYVRGWDLGATAGAGDFTVGVKMGKTGDGFYYVTDMVRDQWDTNERDKMIRLTAELDGLEVRQRGPQDPAAAGKSAALAFKRLLAGFGVTTKPVSGDKQLRADPFSSQVNAGNVKLLKGDWNAAFIEELRQFPQGKHDDIVDAASDAFNEVCLFREYNAV